MKHLIGIGVLIAVAVALRFWPHTSLALDIPIHDTYLVIPLSVIGFWLLFGVAYVWFVVVTWASIRRHS